jgi:phosphatidylinositol-3-phosphatase
MDFVSVSYLLLFVRTFTFKLPAAGLGALGFLALAATAFARVDPKRIPPPRISHLFIIVEENRDFSEVVGSTGRAADWPFFNSLISSGALVTNSFATGHPSIDNYFMLTTGRPVTHNDSFEKMKINNVVRVLDAAGLSWKAYVEDLPTPPIADGFDPYAKNHDPFAYFSDVVNSTTKQANMVDFSQLVSDEAAVALPDYAFVVPNACHSGHGTGNGTPCSGFSDAQLDQSADQFLQDNVPNLLNSSQMASDGLVIITWDEGAGSDRVRGGGHIPTLLLGPMVRPGFEQATRNIYPHQAILRLMLQALGVSDFPGSSRGAPMMGEFFLGSPL